MPANNIITYAETFFDTFDETDFTAVDSLILSSIAYIHIPPKTLDAYNWTGVRLTELFRAEYFPQMFDEVWDPAGVQKLLTAMAANPRFRDMKVMKYTEQFDAVEEKQFAAVTFQLHPDLYYIAFRGTDSTLVGWKEDFNMAFKFPVPAQKSAVRYLTEAAGHCTGELLIGGHSKGGNLAVYSAAYCAPHIQQRIGQIFSHDGPGFLEQVLKSEAFHNISPRIHKTIPQSSIVGMLLEHQEEYQVVKSRAISFMQHDPFSWIIHDRDFYYIEQLSLNARYLDRTLSDWLRSIPENERERFIDSLYSILTTSDVSTFTELRSGWQKNVPAIAHAASQLDTDTKIFLLRTLKELAALSVKNFPEMLKER